MTWANALLTRKKPTGTVAWSRGKGYGGGLVVWKRDVGMKCCPNGRVYTNAILDGAESAQTNHSGEITPRSETPKKRIVR